MAPRQAPGRGGGQRRPRPCVARRTFHIRSGVHERACRATPRDGLGSHASGFDAAGDLISTKCSRWPPLAAARIRTGVAPREGVQPGLCALPVRDGPQLGTRVRAAAARGQPPGDGGRGAYTGGRSRAAPNNPLRISEGENTAREFSVFDK